MKFGRVLDESAHPGLKQYYIAYKDLKKAIKLITGELHSAEDSVLPLFKAGPITRSPESQFQELLDRELTKINNFSAVQFSALNEEVREIIYRLTHSSSETGEALATLREEVVVFDEYIRLNFTGFRKALKKFDKWNKSDSSHWFLQRIVRSDFMVIPIDQLLFGISLVEALSRAEKQIGNACNPSRLAFHNSPHLFVRSKFFVAPEDLVRIETELLRSCSALFAFPLTQEDPLQISACTESFTGGTRRQAEISFTESVVIFENSGFSQTAARRSKKQSDDFTGYCEPVFSVRWNQAQQKEGKCTIVRETHPKYAAASSILFHAEVSQKHFFDLISGRIDASKFTRMQSEGQAEGFPELVSAFSVCLSKNSPSALYSYRRTLMQFSESTIFIALDKDIKFLDLRTVAGSFFKAPISQFQSILTQRVMTVWKARQMETLPDFLASIIGKPSVSEVGGFSKAIHAETILHVVSQSEGKAALGMPRWFLHTVSVSETGNVEEDQAGMSPLDSPSSGKFDVLPNTDANSKLIIHDIVSSREPKQAGDFSVKKETPRKLPLPTMSPLLGSDLGAPLLRTPESNKVKKQSLIDQVKYVLFGSIAPEIPEPESKIEPKTFLANERTFLNWCYVAFIVQAAAVTLVSVDPDAHLEGSLLSLVALVTLVWSLNVYRLRVVALRSMRALDALLVSSNGPTFVCLSVASALTITWIGRLRKYFSHDIL